MQGLIHRVAKRIPFTRYLLGTVVQRGKKNSTFFSYKKNFQENPVFEATKVDADRSLYSDRMHEITTYFHISQHRLLLHYLRNGTPNTNYYRQRIEEIFDKQGVDENSLMKSYERAAFMYANRLMLRYHNYHLGLKVMTLAREVLHTGPEHLQVLDYGCGAADPSLLLALHGAGVTIVDLEDQKFDFARYRFDIRHLPVTTIAASQTEHPVEIKQKFNVILMAEFLEHVRSPREFLTFALDHLEAGGLFYDSMGPGHSQGVGGQHLKEAAHELENTDYKEFFENYLRPVNRILQTTDYPHFYVKV